MKTAHDSALPRAVSVCTGCGQEGLVSWRCVHLQGFVV